MKENKYEDPSTHDSPPSDTHMDIEHPLEPKESKNNSKRGTTNQNNKSEGVPSFLIF